LKFNGSKGNWDFVGVSKSIKKQSDPAQPSNKLQGQSGVRAAFLKYFWLIFCIKIKNKL